jgi:hypothetical protein
MLAKRLIFTWLTGIFFIIALFHAGLIQTPLAHTVVSVTSDVRQGGVNDGSLHVVRVESVPSIPVQDRVMNSDRTLRAFVSPASSPRSIYVEQLTPYSRFLITGSIVTAHPILAVWWNADGTMAFSRQVTPSITDMVMVDLSSSRYEVYEQIPPPALPVLLVP